MTRMRSASPRALPRARGKNRGWPPASTPRAMPLTLSGRCAPSNHQHLAVRRVRLGESRDRIGDARARGDGDDTAFARYLCPPFRGERRRLLVTHIDDADAVLLGTDEDRPDVAAVESKKVAD